jgi:hypothetical protein
MEAETVTIRELCQGEETKCRILGGRRIARPFGQSRCAKQSECAGLEQLPNTVGIMTTEY